jgi:hypothetical protein
MFARMSRYYAVSAVRSRYSARSDLGFYSLGASMMILRGAGLRPFWRRELFEIHAHPAALCPAEASLAYRHDDNRRPARAHRCGSLRLAFSFLDRRRVCRARPVVGYLRALVITSGSGAGGAGGRSTGPDAPATANVRDVPRAAAPYAPTSPAADYPQGPVTFQPGGRLSVGHSLAEELDSWN